MKIRLDKGEWYPVYTIDEEYGSEYEIPFAVITRLRACQQAFEKVQDEIRELIAGQR
jgi:hypothetical protein